jgi:nucleoside-diphosphate-sugar epimerase
MTRDLAVRWPALVLPKWARNRSQPVAIDDVVAALVAALSIDDEDVGTYAVPGPEALSAKEILERVAALAGTRLTMREVPYLPPSLVGRGLGLMTRADRTVAKELAYGLLTDVLADDDGIWDLLPGHRRTPFDEAARTALADEARTVSLFGRALEAALTRARRAAGR